MITVLVVDDQAVVREGIRAMLELSGEVRVLATADSAETMLDRVNAAPPDFVLTDLRMPGMGGVRGIEELRRRHPAVRCVALTTYDDTSTVAAALRAGAAGFLTKDADLATIVQALRAAVEGRSLLDRSVLDRFLRADTEPATTAPGGAAHSPPD